MCSRTDLLREMHKEHGATDLVELSVVAELLRNRQKVQRGMLLDKGLHRLEYHPVLLGIEAARGQFAHSVVDAVRLDEKRAEDSLFDVKGLRWFIAQLKP